MHVDDLAALAADVAAGKDRVAADPADGPVEQGFTVVNVAAGPATARDYYETVTGALGVEPIWDEAPGWTGRILAGRAQGGAGSRPWTSVGPWPRSTRDSAPSGGSSVREAATMGP